MLTYQHRPTTYFHGTQGTKEVIRARQFNAWSVAVIPGVAYMQLTMVD
jgi:hypothetical protein